MWKNKKLRRSIPDLMRQLSEGFALIVYVRASGRGAIREAIATRCPAFLPQRDEPVLNKRPRRRGLINYYEFDSQAGDVGWRSFYRGNIIGWAPWDWEADDPFADWTADDPVSGFAQ